MREEEIKEQVKNSIFIELYRCFDDAYIEGIPVEDKIMKFMRTY